MKMRRSLPIIKKGKGKHLIEDETRAAKMANLESKVKAGWTYGDIKGQDSSKNQGSFCANEDLRKEKKEL
jgi:hypothetical protein